MASGANLLLRLVVLVCLAALQLTHPTWTDGSVATAVTAAGVWWLPLHLLLIVAYAALAALLWPRAPRRMDRSQLSLGGPPPPPHAPHPADLPPAAPVHPSSPPHAPHPDDLPPAAPVHPSSPPHAPHPDDISLHAPVGASEAWRRRAAARLALAAFLLLNTAFLLVDGVAVGALATSDPSAADALWTSPLTTALADASGAAWCAALLMLARTTTPGRNDRLTRVLLSAAWLTFVGSAALPPLLVAAFALVAVAAYRVYLNETPRSGLAFALFGLAALARQHVGLDAALGTLWIALAEIVRGRSAPAAASPPESASRR